MNQFNAHSENSNGESHSLPEHLKGVADIAREFAAPFGGGDIAYYAGLWHDLGKFNPEFQEYLLGNRSRGPDHKAAGTHLAAMHLGIGALMIQGHHGGLQALKDLKGWLAEKGSVPAVQEALERAHREIQNLEPTGRVNPPAFITHDPVKAELWLRMVFSALVDADFLDTEQHFEPERTTTRTTVKRIAEIWEPFKTRHQERTADAIGWVNEIRAEVYDACLTAAEKPQGVFRLAVPTGGGKTLSAMGFALRHAVKHGLERVIVATPFMSITQQTAEVYREFMEESPGPESPVVLEHHSMAEMDEGEEYDQGRLWARLAAENWDAPVVVTTTVQLFNSLFSNRTSSTRKLHRLAKSVIILDEIQSLPPSLLVPILDVLRDLTENFGTTVVLSTATQPAFRTIKAFSEVAATDIVPNSSEHFQELKRVSYEWMNEPKLSWEETADLMRESSQVLAIVNTKKDALALLEALDDDSALHLSTLLCGRHRQRTIQEIMLRLEQGEACRVVSTQVVEAGVDVDFPMVMRAMGPLDSIIQAAGRCNRSGNLDKGRVIVFQPETGSLPPGIYRTATQIAMSMASTGALDPDCPETVSEFFRQLFSNLDLDLKRIQGLRKSFDYPEVGRRFRMIDDSTIEVIVPGYGTPEEQLRVQGAIDELRAGTPSARQVLRRVQPWAIQIYANQVPSMNESGLVAELMPGVFEWQGDYHRTTGIGGVTALDPDRLIV